jgi:regulatory protein
VAKPQSAVETALRALRAGDRSAAELDRRLAKRGAEPEERREALALLERVGYVNDDRFALGRARVLAERGSGDALIRDDLERRGIAGATLEAALASLEPEQVRAGRIASARGSSVKTARYLAARGFEEDAVSAAIAPEDAGEVD